uniref:Secreted protein n=1 Tax=Heterorhabditis bacteriophora TaxID=37862 RepID=A0A1I7WZ86_HETBA
MLKSTLSIPLLLRLLVTFIKYGSLYLKTIFSFFPEIAPPSSCLNPFFYSIISKYLPSGLNLLRYWF